MQNTALLRRRIRDPHFTLENHKVGGRSQTDVVLAYMDNQVNQGDLESLRAKLDAISVGSVAMSQESVAEAIVQTPRSATPSGPTPPPPASWRAAS